MNTNVVPIMDISKNAAIVLNSFVYVMCESCKAKGPAYEGPEVLEKLGVYSYNLKELNSIMERVIYLWNLTPIRIGFPRKDKMVKIHSSAEGTLRN